MSACGILAHAELGTGRIGCAGRQNGVRHLGLVPGQAVQEGGDVLFLLAAVGVIGVSGWLLTTDWGWGNSTLEEIHETAVNITLVAIALRVGAAIYEGLYQRENLVKSMSTGTSGANRAGVSLALSWAAGRVASREKRSRSAGRPWMCSVKSTPRCCYH
ncbi:cytochrome b/b6 domain-containing protein [Modicisalibacter ilicicola]|uniref:cytochrome b/b6 domain-containing protein n=1 Tax=Modicisalibacter ilicicola TaxID=480814 RepID=UPI0015879976|nr:cytochrome b/b6 domain-containing protein [Halomonas ilicicola]